MFSSDTRESARCRMMFRSSRELVIATVIVSFVLVVTGPAVAQEAPPAGTRVAPDPLSVAPANVEGLRAPHFEQNVGQFEPEVLFVARGVGGTVDVRADRLVFQPAATGVDPIELVLEGAGPVVGKGAMRSASTTSYLLVEENRVLTTPLYRQVALRGIYPGVDLRLRFNDGRLQFDFLLDTGADPAAIRMRIAGTDTVRLDEAEVVVGSGDDTIRLQRPIAFQVSSQVPGRVPVAFGLIDDSLTFRLGEFDSAAPLVIDPVIEFRGWYASEHSDWLLAMDRDPASGITYVGGQTVFEGPTSAQANSATMVDHVTGATADANRGSAVNCGGSRRGAAWLGAVTASGTSLLYLCSQQDLLNWNGYVQLKDLDVGDDGNVYATGNVVDGIFVLVARVENGILTPQPWSDGRLLRESTPDDELSWSDAIATVPGVQPNGGVRYYLGGRYRFAANGTFNQGTPCTGNGAWIMEGVAFPDFASQPVYECFGGSGDPYQPEHSIDDIAVDAAGAAYVVGSALTNRPFDSQGQLGPSYGGEHDHFVAKLQVVNGDFQTDWWRYLGGTGIEWRESSRLTLDGYGRVHVNGRTTSVDLLTRNSADFGAFAPAQPTHAGDFDGYYAVLSGDGTTFAYFTYVGGPGFDSVASVSPLDDGTAWLAGDTNGVLGSAWQYSGFEDAKDSPDGRDVFLMRIDPAGSVVWGSYFGGSSYELAPKVWADPEGSDPVVRLAGWTQGSSSSDDWFPDCTPGPGAACTRDNFLLDVVFPPDVVNLLPLADAGADFTVECAPGAGLDVDLDGSASSDPDGDPLTYRWLEDGVEVATGAGPTLLLVPGEHTLTLEVDDGFNPVVSDTVVVTVEEDLAPPEWDLIPDDPSSEATAADGAIVELAFAEASDACSEATVSREGALEVYPIGTTEVVYTATDEAGNVTDPLIVVVTVADTTAPSLEVPDGFSLQGTSPDGQSVEYPAVVVSDAVDPEPTLSCTPESGSNFAIGTTTVNCEATDASGNSAQAVFEVELLGDTTPPTFTGAPGTVSAEATNPAGATVDYLGSLQAADDVDDSPQISCSPASGGSFGLGDTSVVCTATDDFANVSDPLTLTVRVVDTTAPTVQVPGDIGLQGTSPAGQPVAYPDATAIDLVDPAPSVSCSPVSGSNFPIGTTTVVCQASDAAGNVGAGTFSVTVWPDTTSPSFTDVPSTIEVEATSGSGAAVDWDGDVAATDDIDSDPLIACVPVSGSELPIGTTEVACTATDDFGNVATATFEVVVTTIPFEVFQVQKLEVDRRTSPRQPLHQLDLDVNEILLRAGESLDPATDGVTIEVETFSVHLPGTVLEEKGGRFEFEGTIGDVEIERFRLESRRNGEYRLDLRALAPDLGGIGDPATVTLRVGNDEGTVVVEAKIKDEKDKGK